MKPSQRWLLAGGLMVGISFMLGTLFSWQMPKIRAFVMVKIEQVSRDHLPLRILPGAIELTVFPLGAELQRVQVAPKDEIRPFLSGASFESIQVSISPWQLLRGKLRLTNLTVTGARIDATVPPPKKKSGPPLEGLFELIAQIPINHLALEDVNVRLALAEPKLNLVLEGVDLNAEKQRGGALAVDLTSGSVQIMRPSGGSVPSLRIDVETSLSLARGHLGVANLKIRRGDSFLALEGDLKGDVEALDFGSVDVDAKSELHLESMGNWATRAFPETLKKMPAMKGRAFLEGVVKKSDGRNPSADFKARAEGLQIGKFIVDRVSTAGRYENREGKHHLGLPSIAVENPAGHLAIDDFVLEARENETGFSGRAQTKMVQVHELLKTLGVGTIPVHMQISGDIPCTGIFTDTFRLNCKGKARGENLLVRADMKAKGTIAAIREFDAVGEFTVDQEKVSYSAELAMPKSKGRSTGTIGYKTGFKIDYEGEKFSFQDVANLADLKLEGTAKVKGTTEGNSDAATLSLNIDGTDMWLEDFWLGNVRATTTYRAGELVFSNAQGHYTVSRYAGDVRLDLKKREIQINGRAPFYDIRDILKVFSRRVQLPFTVTGTGQAQIKASGPLALNKLSYDLKTSLFRGAVASETFDQVHFDVKSVGGEVKAERVQLIKGTSTIGLVGTGHPDGSIKTRITGRDFKLENSVIVSSAGLALSGVVDFDMDMAGPVLAPDTDMRGQLTRTSIGDQAMADSTFRLKFGSKTLEGEGQLLGDVMTAKFMIPFNPNSPFSLKVVSRDWNFAPLFAAISGPANRRDYEGRLSATVDLAATTGGFWNSSGSARIDRFSLTRGSLAMSSKEPLSIAMKNGHIQIGKFELSGENTFLRVTHNPQPVAKADLQVNGKLDMSLLALLTPFFEDLRGTLSTAFNLRAGPESIDLLGSAYVEKGYLKFFGFPHPIEDIRIDLLFNQKKILFNTVKAEIGGGRVSGSGGMELKGPKNYPVNVVGQFEKVSLNVPDKVRTSGSGNLSFSGSWFPFLLKADYQVRDGNLTKEFGGDGADSSSIRRDQFLPELLLQDRFTPILVDLSIDFNRGIQAKNELIDGRLAGALTVKGNPSKPSILGSVTMEKDTRIMVKDTPFDVTTANIQFTDPNEINPKLYIVARSRVQEYDVNLLLQGTASSPALAFTSVPQLSEKEIISLLALGTTETKTNPVLQTTGQQTSSQSPQISAGALKNNPLSKEIKEKTGFELQFDPSIDESTVVQKIILKRQFTNKFGVAASQALGQRRSTDAEVRYRLNEKLSGVLSWQNRDEASTTDKIKNEQNRFGLDLEYKFEFK